MVNISNNVAKLISTTFNQKSGTTVSKLLMPQYGSKAMATVVNYGDNNPLKQRGIDAFVKITGGTDYTTIIDRALFSGDKIILSGASKAEHAQKVGNFNTRLKEMVDLLKKYPKLTADVIPDTSKFDASWYGEAINKFQG